MRLFSKSQATSPTEAESAGIGHALAGAQFVRPHRMS